MPSFRIPLLVLMTLVGVILPGFGHSGVILDRVMKRGTIRIGVPFNRIPQGFFDAQGALVGFEVELAAEMARHLGLTPEVVMINDVTWGPMLAEGRIDAALCAIRHTRSFRGRFDFSDPYFFDYPAIIVTRGRFKTLSDLSGCKIATVAGSSFEKEALRLLRDIGDKEAVKNVVSYPDGPFCFFALGLKKVDGWIDSGMNLVNYVAKSSGQFELIKAGTSVVQVAVALPPDDSAWRNLFNSIIQDMAGDGTHKKIYNKWFGSDKPHALPMPRPIEILPE